MREYRDGDDLRRIHWPATARTGELMVRQEDRPAKRRAVVVLDTRAVGHGGSGRSSSLEWCVTPRRRVTAHVVDAGYAVHLLTADAARRQRRAPRRDPPGGPRVAGPGRARTEDGLRAVLHAATRSPHRAGSWSTSVARSVTTTPAPCRPCASPVPPARRWSSTPRRSRAAPARARADRPGRRDPGHPPVLGLDDDPGRRAHHAGARLGCRRRRPGRGGPVNRVRPVEALLAALATLAVTLPLTTLFTPSTWFRPSVLLVSVVALVGMGLRRITANRPLVVVGQVVLLVNAAALMHGRGHLWAACCPPRRPAAPSGCCSRRRRRRSRTTPRRHRPTARRSWRSACSSA